MPQLYQIPLVSCNTPKREMLGARNVVGCPDPHGDAGLLVSAVLLKVDGGDLCVVLPYAELGQHVLNRFREVVEVWALHHPRVVLPPLAWRRRGEGEEVDHIEAHGAAPRYGVAHFFGAHGFAVFRADTGDKGDSEIPHGVHNRIFYALVGRGDSPLREEPDAPFDNARALLLGGAYLIWRKVISWRIPVAFIGTVGLLTLIFGKSGYGNGQWMLMNLFSGSLFLGAFFMATDYATSPVTLNGQLVFGAGCGLLTVLIRYFGGFPEGTTYAILIMNLCTWAIDKAFHRHQFGVSKADIAFQKAEKLAAKEAWK